MLTDQMIRENARRRDDAALRSRGILTDERKFNPGQPRDPGGFGGGQWIDTTPGDGAVGTLKDALRLAGKIDLDKDEKLLGSAKVGSDFGVARLALTEQNGKRSLRLGLGDTVFGSRDDEAGPWRGNRDSTAQLNAERKRLRDEHDAIGAELDRLEADPNADPKRRAGLQARIDELEDMDTAEVFPSGYTAKLDPESAARLRETLTSGLRDAEKAKADVDAYWDERERLQELGDTAGLEALNARTPAAIRDFDYTVYAEGSVPGEWADVHYEVFLDDVGGVGVEVKLGAVPHDSGMSFQDVRDNEQAAGFDPAETRKLLRLLGKYVA